MPRINWSEKEQAAIITAGIIASLIGLIILFVKYPIAVVTILFCGTVVGMIGVLVFIIYMIVLGKIRGDL